MSTHYSLLLTAALLGSGALATAQLVPDDDVAGVLIAEGYDLRLAVDSLDFPSNLTVGAGRVWVSESGYLPTAPPTIKELALSDSAAGTATIILTPADLPPGTLLPPFGDVTYRDSLLYLSHRQVGANMWPVGAISTFSPDDPAGTFTTIVTNLPSVGDHATNMIVFGADGRGYFGQGSATNTGVVGPDNVSRWAADYPAFREIPPVDVTLRNSGFEARVPSSLDPDSNAVTSPYLEFDSTATGDTYTVPGASPANPVLGMIAGTGTIYSFDPAAADVAASLEVEAWGLRNPFGLSFDAADPARLFVSNNGSDIRGQAGDPNDPLDPETFVIRGNRPVAQDWDEVFAVNVDDDAVEFFGWPDSFHDTLSGDPLPASDPLFCTSPALEAADCPGPLFDSAFAATLTVAPAYAELGPYVSATGLEPSPSDSFGFRGDLFVTQSGSFSPQTGAFSFTGYKVVRIDSAGAVADFLVNEGTTAPELLADGKLNKPVSVIFDGDRMFVVDLGELEPGVNVAETRTGKVWIVERSATDPSSTRTLGAAEGVDFAGVQPNPAGDAASVAFSLDDALSARISIHDLFGREVRVVGDGYRAAGVHRLELSTADLPTGMYVARMTAGGASAARVFSVAH